MPSPINSYWWREDFGVPVRYIDAHEIFFNGPV